MTIVFIRWALTMALIFGVYTETGPFTALSMFLLMLAIELTDIGRRLG